MSKKEINLEVYKDYLKILRSIPRLRAVYNRERKEKEIEKTRVYMREFCIKTKAKNNWIIFMCKAPSLSKYTGEDSIAGASIVYTHNRDGLWVYKPQVEYLAVYYGHLFTRYNQRLALNLNNPVDIIKHFFKYNGFAHHNVIEKEGKKLHLGLCPKGLLLGEMQMNDFWLVNKTFITKDMFNKSQDKLEQELMTSLEKEITTEWNKQVFDKEKVNYNKNMHLVLSGIDLT